MTPNRKRLQRVWVVMMKNPSSRIWRPGGTWWFETRAQARNAISKWKRKASDLKYRVQSYVPEEK